MEFETTPEDFEFLPVFELLRWISNNQTLVSTVLETLRSSLQDADIRKIVKYGIITYYTKANSIEIVKQIHKTIQLVPSTTLNSSQFSNSNVNIYNQTLSIQSIICKVFSYLDLKSYCNCSKVNIQWLYDSYQPSSLHHININKLFNFNPITKEITRRTHLSRFKHVESLFAGAILHQSHPDASGVQQTNISQSYVRTLTRLKKLSILDYAKRKQCFQDTIQVLLSQNKHHLRAIRVECLNTTQLNQISNSSNSNSHGKSVWSYVCDNAKQFPKLEIIDLMCRDAVSSLAVSSFPQIVNPNGLKVLRLLGITYYNLNFWKELIQNEKNLCNMETFYLQMPFVKQENSDFIKRTIIPTICARIIQTNLRKIRLIYPSAMDEYYDRGVGFIEPSFFVLHYLHNISLSMKKLGCFKNNDKVMAFGCNIVLDNSMGVSLRVLNRDEFMPQLEVIKWDYDGGNYNRNLSHFSNLSLDFLNNIKEIELKLDPDESVWSINQLLDFLCFKNITNNDDGEYNNSSNKDDIFEEKTDIITALDVDLDFESENNANNSKTMQEIAESRYKHQVYRFDWSSKNKDKNNSNTNTNTKNKSKRQTVKQLNDADNGNTWGWGSSFDNIVFDGKPNPRYFAPVWNLAATANVKTSESETKINTTTTTTDEKNKNEDKAGKSKKDGLKESSTGDNQFFVFGNNNDQLKGIEDGDNINTNTKDSLFKFGNTNNSGDGWLSFDENNNCTFSFSNDNASSSVNSVSFGDPGASKLSSNSNHDFGCFKLNLDRDNNQDRIGNVNCIKHTSKIEKLILNGCNKIEKQLVFRVLNIINFENNCLKYVKLSGLKLSQVAQGFDQIRRPVEQSIKFWKENINASFDIILPWTIDVSKTDIYANKLVQLLSQMYNDLLTKRQNKNSLVIAIRIKLKNSPLNTTPIDNYSNIKSSWVQSLINGFKKIQQDKIESVSDSKEGQSFEYDSCWWMYLSHGVVKIRLFPPKLESRKQNMQEVTNDVQIQFKFTK